MGRSAVTIVDLGMGNLRSVARAIERAGGVASITSEPASIAAAERLIVPGQGQFRSFSRAIDGATGEAIRALVATGRPYLGICLGMQALFASSEEAPGEAGLALFAGSVRRFPDGLVGRDGTRLKVPHVGWSEIATSHPAVPAGWYYFVHSYYCAPEDERTIAARCEHGVSFAAAVAKDNVVAVQWHPEKSGRDGHELLRRFVEDAWS